MTDDPKTEDIELKIRERAYHLWRESGCAEGQADRHWLAAERDVLASFASSGAATTVQSPRATVAPATVVQIAPETKAKHRAGGKIQRASR